MSTPGASLPRLSRHLAIVAVGLLFAAGCSGATDLAAPTVAHPTPTPTVAVDAEETEVVAPSPTPTAAPESGGAAPSPAATATPTPEPVIQAHGPPAHYGAATPSVSERIFKSDVIVRASLRSAANDELRFNAIEYLKGTGPAEIVVNAATSGRDTTWDGREAVLFLSRPAAGASSAAGEFRFTAAYHHENPGSFGNYAIGTRNPVWLPAATASGASEFITDKEAVTGGPPAPTTSLAALRTKIAWMEGGAGIAGYDACVKAAVNYERWYRDWEAHHGRLWTPHQAEEQLASGTGEGAVVHEFRLRDRNYDRFWLTGQDAALFRFRIDDDDTLAYNGYTVPISTARPLPGGAYRFVDHMQPYYFIPCSFTPKNYRLEWTVTVTAPSGTTHEAFFDPVAIGAGFGADGTNGALKPTAFTVGGSSASLSSLTWRGGSVVLTLSPYAALTGQTLDVLAIDGALTLSLAASAATVDAAAGTLTWSVASQPWQAGDLLMLRLRSGAASPTATPTATPSVTATPTFGPTPTPS